MRTHILVTGATGLLGHYVLAGLVRRHLRCAVLVRPPMADARMRLAMLLADLGVHLAAAEGEGSIELIEGDLHTLPARLPMVLAGIVHIAAATNFKTNSSGDPHRSNVLGTQALLDWAGGQGSPWLHYVSSAYSCGRVTAPVAETLHDPSGAFHNDYEKSKCEGEHVCMRWARQRGTALTIHRPSVIVGAFESGRSTRFAGMYLSARSTEFLSRTFESADRATRHAIPLRIKGRPDDCQNIVPVDYVGEMIAGSVATPSTWGRIYHLTHPAPPSNQQIKEAFEQYFDIGGGRFVEPAAFPAGDLNEHEQRFYEISRSIEHYFVDTPTFLRENTRTLEQTLGLSCPRYGAGDIGRLVAFAQQASWGRESVSRRKVPGCTTYFERFLPHQIAESEVARRTAVSATVRFVIEDDPGREWVCRFERGQLADVRRGANGIREDFGYRSNKEVFWEAIAGGVHPQELFLSGRAEIIGDVERALKMAMILHEFNKECPCDRQTLERMEGDT